MCTLSADQLTVRLAEIRRDIVPYVQHTHRLQDGVALELNNTPGLREKIERVIGLEHECCEGLQFALSDADQTGGLRLEIRGVDPSSESLKQLFGGLENEAKGEAQGGRIRGVLSSAGVGIAGSFFLFCVLSIGLAGLFGASATAYLAQLDSLPVLSGAAMIFAGAAWRWQRRSGLKTEEASGRSCGC
jgi:hypothetical protein